VLLPTASERHLCGDFLTGRRILAETERMQELVYHDDVGSIAISERPLCERPPTYSNDGRAHLCEGQSRPRGGLSAVAWTEPRTRTQQLKSGTTIGSYRIDVWRFLMTKPSAQAGNDATTALTSLVIVQNWDQELRRLVPRK
jgi:hypothetical protein